METNVFGGVTSKLASRLVLFGIGIAGFLGCLDLTIVNTALPAIQLNFNATVTQLQWVMTTLLLALTAFMVIAGKIGDLYGRRFCLYLGLILFAVSSLGAGLADNIYVLISSRFVQGISIAFLYTAPVALIPSIFPVNQHGRIMGILVAANGLGLAVGPALGGLIVSGLGWRWIFFINPPLVLLSIAFCWRRLHESTMESIVKKIDWLGCILLALSLPALILGIVQGEAWGWLSFPIMSLFMVAIVGGIVFFIVENRINLPIIDFHLFSQRIFLIGLSANFCLAFFYAIDFFLIPLYLHFIRGFEGYKIGLMLLPATAMVTLLSSLTGRMVDKQGPKYLLMLGLALCALTAFLQSRFDAGISIYIVLCAYFIFGVAWALILSPSIVAAMSAVSKDHSGVAMGTIGTLHNLGGAVGLAIGTLIYGLGVKSQFLSELPNARDWINDAVANTDNAVNIIMTHAQIALPRATDIFNQAFLQGYRWAMWLLVIVTFIAFWVVSFGLKKNVGSSSKKTNVVH
jgi:EmrB/QacA subfamily drug resistance transporter